MSEQFTIPRRADWSHLDDLTFNIECGPLAPTSVKLGLAVRSAVASGADLSGADLSGAYLYGALIHDEPIRHLIAQVNRQIDPYAFLAFRMQGQSVKVMAGCRWFSIQEFRNHVASEYPDTPKAVETLDILDFIELRASRKTAQ